VSGGETDYRLSLAHGYLAEAEGEMSSARWRACVSGCQLSAENGAKAVLSLIGPVEHTHRPAEPLREACDEGRVAEAHVEWVRALADRADTLGPRIHAQSDYGDQDTLVTPWELFGAHEASEAIDTAREAVRLADALVEALTAHGQ